MEISNDKKRVNGFIYLFMVTYMVSYITRINFAAIISEIVAKTGWERTALSLSLTGIFVTYGLGQLVSGYFGDRFQPKKLVFLGLLTSCAMNVLIPFCTAPYQMVIVWCINGFAQAMMWPPIVKLMVALFSAEDYARACIRVSWGSSFGTIFVYCAAPFALSFIGWKSVFFISAACGLVMALIWNKYCCNIDHISVRPHGRDAVPKAKFFSPLLVAIMIAIVLQGSLRDGVTDWMPSYIADTFHMENSVAILSCVLLPIFSIICYSLAGKIYRKNPDNPVLCGGLIFGVGAIAAAVLYFFNGVNAALSILMSALLTGCMHGVNLMLISYVPSFFKNTGRVSMVSGLLNSCTYVGSAVSVYGFAAISEGAGGWSATVLIWLLVAAAGTVVCLLTSPFWKRFIAKNKEA